MIIAYIIAYAASYLASKAGHYILSGIMLILERLYVGQSEMNFVTDTNGTL